MTNTKHTIPVADLGAYVSSPNTGIISLVGSHGGLSLVVGDVDPSNVVSGTVSVETEHGTVYLDEDGEVEINEDTAR